MRSIEIPQPEDRDFKYRLFEILPAALTYMILLTQNAPGAQMARPQYPKGRKIHTRTPAHQAQPGLPRRNNRFL
jgi:hypothetical protein